MAIEIDYKVRYVLLTRGPSHNRYSERAEANPSHYGNCWLLHSVKQKETKSGLVKNICTTSPWESSSLHFTLLLSSPFAVLIIDISMEYCSKNQSRKVPAKIIAKDYASF
jgi:hypothetical protein